MASDGLINLCDGTVAEWTIAAALKAAGRKARGFESLPFRHVMSRDIGKARTFIKGSGLWFFGVVWVRRWVCRCRGSGGWGRS